MRVILIRGLPGSGKSTLAENICLGSRFCGVDAVFHEADHYFDQLGHFDGSLLPQAHAQCLERFTADLEPSSGYGVVIVSNTFTTHKEMLPYQEACVARGIIPQVITCTGTFGSVHNVPQATIERMRARWEN